MTTTTTVFTQSRQVKPHGKTEFFFTSRYGQKVEGAWCSCSITFPMMASPRPGLEDGFIDTIEKYAFVFHSDETLVPNPNPDYEMSEWYAALPMLHAPGPDTTRNRDKVSDYHRSKLTPAKRALLELWDPGSASLSEAQEHELALTCEENSEQYRISLTTRNAS